MAAAFMQKNGKIKVPKEVRQRLRLKDGDRVVFYWSSQRDTYAIVAQNVDPREGFGMVVQSESAGTLEEADALLNFHRGRDLSREETELVIGVLRRQADEAERDGPSNSDELSAQEDERVDAHQRVRTGARSPVEEGLR